MKLDFTPSLLEIEGYLHGLKDDSLKFFYTHPLPIGVVNLVNGLLSQGVSIPASEAKLGNTIRIAVADLTSTQ